MLDSRGMIFAMPRPKGSRNKKAIEQVESIEAIDERIVAAETALIH